MPVIARQGDQFTGTCRHPSHGGSGLIVQGSISTGSGLTDDQGRPIARVGDRVVVSSGCTHNNSATIVIVNGSPLLSDENKSVARVGDFVSGGYLTGSTTVVSVNAVASTITIGGRIVSGSDLMEDFS